MYIEHDTDDFVGYIDQETNLLAAQMDDEALLKAFRAHNISGVNATVEGDHALATEHYLVADALGNELGHRHDQAAQMALATRQTKIGRFMNRMFGISA